MTLIHHPFLLASSSLTIHDWTARQCKTIVKFSKDQHVETAYSSMTSAIETILTAGDFPPLRRACIHKIKSISSNLPCKLIPQILRTSSMNELLDMLAQSEYWNWFDTRLLEALTYASGSPAAIEMLEHFKNTFYPRKISEFMPYQLVRPFKEFISLQDKFDKHPSELTVYELLEHKYKLEYEVLDIDEGELVLSCIKTGCVELTWQIPQELIYQAYTSMKRKHDELSSLAVKSLVCEEADKFAGLPILWRGQEVGEVGPIEPLPEHVRQEPYSLPQGFHWVTLSRSNVEEVVKFLSKHIITTVFDINFIIKYPTTKDEWQFGIRTTNGKLVGVVLAHPVCISIGGVSLVCIRPCTGYHPKYHNKRMYYMLIKELMRRVNLYDINHLVLTQDYNGILQPMITSHTWHYSFDHPTSNQLPGLPRTPGWRRMTSEDVPSALALVNKWSSQFEIRRIFNGEDEFAHNYLYPKYVFTYVVESKTSNIIDFISFKLLAMPHMPMLASISTVVSTQSPVKQLIIDALVCAKNMGVKKLLILQSYVKSDVLLSFPFQYSGTMNLLLYNYKYHEVPATDTWYLGL